MEDPRSKRSPAFAERSQGAGGVVTLTGDVAARFEAGADSSVGGGWAQHPVDRQGSRSPAADCQPLAASLCRPWPGGAERQAAARQAANLYEGHRQADTEAAG